MLSSTGPRSRSRAILPTSMLLSASWSAVIRGAIPNGRGSCMGHQIRFHILRIPGSMDSSNQS